MVGQAIRLEFYILMPPCGVRPSGLSRMGLRPTKIHENPAPSGSFIINWLRRAFNGAAALPGGVWRLAIQSVKEMYSPMWGRQSCRRAPFQAGLRILLS